MKLFKINCELCGELMKKGSIANRGILMQLFLLMVFIAGLWISLSIIGAIVGIPMMILALALSSGKRKVFKCRQCGNIKDRA